MLIIRDAQMTALERPGRERFAREVIAAVEASSPHSVKGLPAPEIDARLAAALLKADRHQLRTVRDLRAFIRLCFVVGQNFDEYPPLRTLLNVPPQTPSDGPILALFARATERDWDRAAVFDVLSRFAKPIADSRRAARSISIRPLRIEDSEPYFHQASHPDVWRLGRMKPLRSLLDTQRFVRTMRDRRDCQAFAIVDDTGSFIGAVFLEYSESFGQISYWVNRSCWGQGVASIAVTTALSALRNVPGLTRATAAIACDNLPSIRVIEKCGFVADRRDDGTADVLHFTRDVEPVRGLERA